MEDKHRKLLQVNRTKLISNISNPKDVCELLYEKRIFTESMKQEVEAEKTENNQIRKILDIIPKRGPTAFDIFYDSLLAAGNGTAADLLKPELKSLHPEVRAGEQRNYIEKQIDIDLPKGWPDVDAMDAPVNVKHCNVNSDIVKNYWIHPTLVYSMKRQIRGRCLIISNQVFRGPIEKKNGVNMCILPERHGTEKDVTRMSELFQQLHFEIDVRTDLTAQELRKCLDEERMKPSHDSAECFTCVICSHGTTSGIYGTDGNIVPIDEVTRCFDGQHCTALIGKPKLFFIQACQGEMSDRPKQDVMDSGPELSHMMTNLTVGDSQPFTSADGVDGDKIDACRIKEPVPTKLDIFVAAATHPGYVSLRNMSRGSWFLQAVILVFQKFACDWDIDTLLVLVKNLVSRGKTALNNEGETNVMQAARTESSLSKKLFFFPGIIADTKTM